jgi:hypothetical protein
MFLTEKQLKDVKEIAHSSPTAEVVFALWALRGRDRKEPVTLRRLKARLFQLGVKVSESDFDYAFGMLESFGFGSVTKGRFSTVYSLKLLGKQADISPSTLKNVAARLRAEMESRKSSLMAKVGITTKKPEQNKPERILKSLKEQVIQKTVVMFVINGKTLRLEVEGDVTPEQINHLASVLGQMGTTDHAITEPYSAPIKSAAL